MKKMKYEIEPADNGWIVSWWDDVEDNKTVQRHIVFQIPEDVDTFKEDPQVLIDLLYFVKEDICGQYYSKHKSCNVVVRFEEGEND